MTYALTVRQPWAALIIAGAKTAEYRTWQTRYRGRLYVHAASKPDPDAAADLTRLLVFGAIIGYAELTAITGRPGAYEWHLAGPVAIEPVPCRGRPGLWPWPSRCSTKSVLPFYR